MSPNSVVMAYLRLLMHWLYWLLPIRRPFFCTGWAHCCYEISHWRWHTIGIEFLWVDIWL